MHKSKIKFHSYYYTKYLQLYNCFNLLLTFFLFFVLMYDMPIAKKGSLSSILKNPLQQLSMRLMYVVLLIAFLVIGYLLGKLEGTNPAVQGENQTAAGQTGNTQALPQEPGAPDPEEVLKTLDEGHLPVKGKASAPVTIIEFSDFQCPFCRSFYTQTLPQIEKEYVETGKVKMYYRHLPLAFHAQARPFALASECANEQGKFWELHDKIFDEQEKLGQGTVESTVDDIKAWASEIGLNASQFNQCLDSEKYAENVDNDNSVASKVNATGTPTFYINGKQIVGAQPFSSFKAIIDQELEG